MSDNKKYYYLKLKDNFFESDEMIVLESMPDGYKYSNILLKLYLRSLKNEGKLMFNDRIPYNSTILAQVTRHSVGDVERAVQILKELGLIEVLDNGAIYITDIHNFIGQSSTEADRVREYRRRIENDKNQLSTNVQTNVRTNVRQMNTRDRDRDRDKDRDIYSAADADTNVSVPSLDDGETKKENKPSLADLKNDFEKLWSLYPNKKSKPRAFTAYKRAIKDGVTNKGIQEGIVSYKKEIEIKGTDKQFIKHGGTWFNNQGWEDEYNHEPPKKNYRKGSNYNEIIPEWVNKTDEPMQEEPTENKETIDEEELRRRLDELMGEDDDVQDND